MSKIQLSGKIEIRNVKEIDLKKYTHGRDSYETAITIESNDGGELVIVLYHDGLAGPFIDRNILTDNVKDDLP